MSAEELRLYHILTPEKVAEYLAVHVATLHKWRRACLIGHIKVRGTVRFRMKDVLEFIRNHLTPAVA